MRDKKQVKHFTAGPVELYPFTRAIYDNDYFYFRTEEFGSMVNDCLKRVNKLIGNNEEGSLIYMTASGTAAMEAVVENCTNHDDKVLVINGGTFGQRFCNLLEYHSINFKPINLKWDEELKYFHFEPFENQGYTALFVNLHETSTGHLYDIEMLSDFCKRNNMMLIVDAISTFLADEYDMEKMGIDVTITSSQKGFCLSPGLSFISFSKRMMEKVNKNSFTASKYFDFKDYFENIKRGQTPYTPAVFIIYELKAMLDYIDSVGGKEGLLNTVKEKCRYFRELALSSGLKIPDTYRLSNMLTPIACEDYKASELVKHLRDKYKLCVNPCGGELADKLFRVSHIGNTTIDDIDELMDKILISIDEIKRGAECL